MIINIINFLLSILFFSACSAGSSPVAANERVATGSDYAHGVYREIITMSPNFGEWTVLPAEEVSATLENQTGSVQDKASKRIRFPKGSGETIVNGKLFDGKPATYLVSVKAGQTISVKVINGKGNEDVFFEIITPDRNSIGSNEWDMDAAVSRKIRKSGDYLIWISSTENQSPAYKLQISIR